MLCCRTGDCQCQLPAAAARADGGADDVAGAGRHETSTTRGDVAPERVPQSPDRREYREYRDRRDSSGDRYSVRSDRSARSGASGRYRHGADTETTHLVTANSSPFRSVTSQ